MSFGSMEGGKLDPYGEQAARAEATRAAAAAAAARAAAPPPPPLDPYGGAPPPPPAPPSSPAPRPLLGSGGGMLTDGVYTGGRIFVTGTSLPTTLQSKPAYTTPQAFIPTPAALAAANTPRVLSPAPVASFVTPAPAFILPPDLMPLVFPGTAAPAPAAPWSIAGHPVTLPMVAIGVGGLIAVVLYLRRKKS